MHQNTLFHFNLYITILGGWAEPHAPHLLGVGLLGRVTPSHTLPVS